MSGRTRIQHPVEGVIVASVVPPLTGIFEKLSQRYFGQTALVVGDRVQTGVRIRYDNPAEVGADRVVNAVAAYHRYGGAGLRGRFWHRHHL